MKNRTTPSNVTKLEPDQIFVFGSNLAGIHGAGAAFYARHNFGACPGEGVGLTGDCYAFPTKDRNIQTLPIDKIAYRTNGLEKAVTRNPDKTFLITAVGCGLAGYTVNDIAPLFRKLSTYQNVWLPAEFWEVLGRLNTVK